MSLRPANSARDPRGLFSPDSGNSDPADRRCYVNVPSGPANPATQPAAALVRDLRTPLATILEVVDLLSNYDLPPQRRRELLNQLEHEALRLDGILADAVESAPSRADD